MIEKAVLIKTSPPKLFPLINTLNQWPDWSAWSSESDFKFEYNEKKAGFGAVQIWQSNKINGVLTITQSNPDNEMQYQLDVKEGNFNLLGTIVLSETNSEFTQIAWRCELKKLKNHNPLKRLQAYFLKKYFESTIESSIIGLQKMFE